MDAPKSNHAVDLPHGPGVLWFVDVGQDLGEAMTKPQVVKKTKQNKGNPHPKPGPGRPKGSQNKVTKALKEQILGALEAKDGQAWFEARMDDQPAAFMALLGKILPSEMTATLQNPDGGPFSITVKFVKPQE